MKSRFPFALIVLIGGFPSLAFASEVIIPDHPPVPAFRPVAEAEKTATTETNKTHGNHDARADYSFQNAPIPALRENAVGALEQAKQDAAILLSTPAAQDNPIASTVPSELQASTEPLAKRAAPTGQKSTDRTSAEQTPVDEAACRAELTKAGVKFAEAEPQSNPSGCSMPHPVAVSSLGSDVEIKPVVIINCQTALASARFVASTINPSAIKEFKSPVKSIAQASGYVCRPRNGTQKLSEHAYGNALDIAAFTLKNGVVVHVKPAPPADQERFLREVRDAACGPFKTVLGPGSNADHSEHLHFDLAPRRNDSTYCK